MLRLLYPLPLPKSLLLAVAGCLFLTAACTAPNPVPDLFTSSPLPIGVVISPLPTAGVGPLPAAPSGPTPTGEALAIPPAPVALGNPGAQGRIVYHSDVSGEFRIYSMNADGSDVRQVSNGPGNDTDPAWSPDGKQIAFTSNREGNYDVYLVNADGSDIHRLTNDPSIDWGPAWYPDGSHLLFASNRDGNQMHLYSMKLDGSDQAAVETGGTGWAGQMSPVRNEIVFVSDRSGGWSEIYLLSLDSNVASPLTFGAHPHDRPVWSPDGTQIVYQASKENTDLIDPDEIYVILRTGGTPRQLTNNVIGDITPSWSPDGQWIIFSSSRGGGWNIFVMPVTGNTQLFQLTRDSSWNREPKWIR